MILVVVLLGGCFSVAYEDPLKLFIFHSPYFAHHMVGLKKIGTGRVLRGY